MFRKLLDEGRAGDNVGVLLRGVGKGEVERGQVLATPDSITPHTGFDAQVYVLTKDEGGRHNPFFAGYQPQFYFRTTDVTGRVGLPEGVEMVMPETTRTCPSSWDRPSRWTRAYGSLSEKVAAPWEQAPSPKSPNRRMEQVTVEYLDISEKAA